jgi:hypothetical protein
MTAKNIPLVGTSEEAEAAEAAGEADREEAADVPAAPLGWAAAGSLLVGR